MGVVSEEIVIRMDRRCEMNMVEVGRDELTELILLRDTHAPPRYYLQAKSRRDPMPIGDRKAALRRFFLRVDQATRRQARRMFGL